MKEIENEIEDEKKEKIILDDVNKKKTREAMHKQLAAQ